VTGEVSCISKRNGMLEGRAVDPVTAGLVLDGLLGEDHFARTGGDVLCLGAGGAASAIALHFIANARPGDRPHRFVAVDLRPDRLERLRAMVDSLDTTIPFTYLCHDDPACNDALLDSLPTSSLIINATGLGKDRPGSPLTGAARFPRHGIVWELNYRGELDFMRQALAQQESRSLVVEDGWRYFLHGWTHVIAHVFHMAIDPTTFDRLAAIAAAFR
jgi:shikimate dehydrogenase